MYKPIVAITIGDPAGIGPEITGKALLTKAVHAACIPFVIGDISLIPGFGSAQKKFGCPFVNIPFLKRLRYGLSSRDTGRASYEYIISSLELIGKKKAYALVTAPICKESIHLAKINFPGHTELLAAHTHTKNFAMMMAAGNFRTIMVTRHIPVSSVGKTITVNRIVETASLADGFLKARLGIRSPRIGICALNPHGGEAGLIGKEEINIILPAVKKLSASGIHAQGPIPADSAWKEHSAGKFDMLITMYHDQAMIPLKCLAPEKIVNITVGLPFIRTSPGHGTAFNIAGKNKADPRPMIEAILCAARFSQVRLARQ